jgi:hypothetical protein
MTGRREFKESPLGQGSGEEIVYGLTTTPWCSSPTTPTLTVIDETTGGDVTASVTSGSTTATGDVITLAKIKSLVAGRRYRFEVTWAANGSTWAAYGYIDAED